MRRTTLAGICTCIFVGVATWSPSARAAPVNEEAKAVGLFFRTLTPTLIWGKNGILTAPSAVTAGTWHIGVQSSVDYAGKVQDEVMLDLKESVTFTTDGAVEVGYTRKDLVWVESGERSPLSSTILHAKYTALDFKDKRWWWVPKLAVGASGYKVTDRDDFNLGDVFIEGFAVASEIIDLRVLTARLHVGGNIGVLASRSTRAYLFGGADFTFLGDWVTVAIEHVGASQSGLDGVTNAGAAVNIFRIVQVGAQWFNFLDRDNDRVTGTVAVSLPLGEWFGR